jgi:hypothetical protein
MASNAQELEWLVARHTFRQRTVETRYTDSSSSFRVQTKPPGPLAAAADHAPLEKDRQTKDKSAGTCLGAIAALQSRLQPPIRHLDQSHRRIDWSVPPGSESCLSILPPGLLVMTAGPCTKPQIQQRSESNGKVGSPAENAAGGSVKSSTAGAAGAKNGQPEAPATDKRSEPQPLTVRSVFGSYNRANKDRQTAGQQPR